MNVTISFQAVQMCEGNAVCGQDVRRIAFCGVVSWSVAVPAQGSAAHLAAEFVLWLPSASYADFPVLYWVGASLLLSINFHLEDLFQNGFFHQVHKRPIPTQSRYLNRD